MFAIDQNLFKLLDKLSSRCTQDCQAYLVGGFVRDWLMGRETADLDITVSGDALLMAQEMAEAVDGNYVLLDEENEVGRVVVAGDSQPWHLDVTSFSNSIEHDLLRRDFTINAMAISLPDFVSGAPHLIDPLSGEIDLKKGLLRQVNSGVFREDPSRLMRAVRLAAELHFDIEPETESSIRRDCDLARMIPGEKIREELLRLLALPYSCNLIRYLDELGLLTEIIPELEELKEIKQPKEHYWDVYNHSLETMATVEFLLRESDWAYGKKDLLVAVPWSEEIQNHFDEEVSAGSKRRTLIKLGALLHDIAKPRTKTVEDTGKVRFLGHPKQGSTMATAILERLRFSSKEINLVEQLVYHHLHPAQMSSAGLPTSRAIYRYFRDTEGAGIDVLFLALADYLATHGPRLNTEEWEQQNQLMKYILEEHFKQQEQIMLVKLVDGHDLIETLKLSPGRLVGELLTTIREAQVSGEINTRDEAIALARKQLEKGYCCIAG